MPSSSPRAYTRSSPNSSSARLCASAARPFSCRCFAERALITRRASTRAAVRAVRRRPNAAKCASCNACSDCASDAGEESAAGPSASPSPPSSAPSVLVRRPEGKLRVVATATLRVARVTAATAAASRACVTRSSRPAPTPPSRAKAPPSPSAWTWTACSARSSRLPSASISPPRRRPSAVSTSAVRSALTASSPSSAAMVRRRSWLASKR